ncbi:MAG: rhamnose ABC transporter substrate-binding protein [Actinobacteria bacterium]|nr:rhamnose ABC transporter substrate-binding protein [Actinomycetota bacterium]
MKKVLSAIGIAALAATAFVATPAQAATKLKIAHIPKLGTIGYFQAAHKGVERACKELKATCAYKGPTEITAAAQVKEINAAVQGGYNVLIVAANDKDALVPALKAAMKKKVTVVTYDSDVAEAGRSVFVNQASSEGIGQALAKSASDLAGGSGDIAILSTTPDATNQNVWIDYMKKELAAKYPDVKVVATAYGLDKPEESTTETQGLIQKYPTIKAIVAPTSVGIVAAAKYVSGSASKGKVFVTGLGLPNDMKTYIKDGSGAQASLWDVENFGYVSVYVANDIRNKKAKTTTGSTFKGGPTDKGLKSRQVIDQVNAAGKVTGNEIVLGPATVFTKDNVDQFNF